MFTFQKNLAVFLVPNYYYYYYYANIKFNVSKDRVIVCKVAKQKEKRDVNEICSIIYKDPNLKKILFGL